MFEDTKRVIRIRKSTKDKQHNGQKKKNQKVKQRSTKHTHKTKYTALKIGYYCSLKNNNFVEGTQFLIQLYVQSIEQIRYHVHTSYYSMTKLSIKTILQHFE